MEIKFNVTGVRRKQLVVSISEVIGAKPEYQGAPTFAYVVDYFMVDKSGTLIFDDRADSGVIENLMDELLQKGFEAEPCEKTVNESAEKTIGLNIELPADDISDAEVETLNKLISSRAALIKKSIGTQSEPTVLKQNGRLIFPWFTAENSPDELVAYTQLCTALAVEAKKLKRVNSGEKVTDNEKFAFRTFLVRIGMVGDEYKTARKTLLKNLDGNLAFRHGKPETETISNG